MNEQENAARVVELEAALAKVREVLGEIREVWAGSECGEPKYAQEAYAIKLCKQMYQLACDAPSPTGQSDRTVAVQASMSNFTPPAAVPWQDTVEFVPNKGKELAHFAVKPAAAGIVQRADLPPQPATVLTTTAPYFHDPASALAEIENDERAAEAASFISGLERAAEIAVRRISYSMPIPCPDNMPGCCVAHSVPATREQTGAEVAEAIRAEINRAKGG